MMASRQQRQVVLLSAIPFLNSISGVAAFSSFPSLALSVLLRPASRSPAQFSFIFLASTSILHLGAFPRDSSLFPWSSPIFASLLSPISFHSSFPLSSPFFPSFFSLQQCRCEGISSTPRLGVLMGVQRSPPFPSCLP